MEYFTSIGRAYTEAVYRRYVAGTSKPLWWSTELVAQGKPVVRNKGSFRKLTIMVNYNLHVWLDDKPHSVEGHTARCTLFYKDKQVWGPVTCHDNTTQLRDAIQQADDRFALAIEPKTKTVEGHTRYISVSSKGNVLLDKLSTHDNMVGLVAAIDAILAAEG